MALHKRAGSAPPKMPFPGESPTVSLALAAGQMYGLNEVQEASPKATPAKAGKKKKSAARPSRKPAAKAKAKGR